MEMQEGGGRSTQMAFRLRGVENRQRGDVSSTLEFNLTEVNKDGNQLTELNTNQEVCVSGSCHNSVGGHGFEGYSRVKEYLVDEREGNTCFNGTLSKKLLNEEIQAAVTDDLYSMLDAKSDGSRKAGISSAAATYSIVSNKGEDKISSHELLRASTKKVYQAGEPVNSAVLSGNLASSTPQSGAAISHGKALLPSSFLCSISSDKSTLNPNTKEFKFNPNAESFVPSQSSLRPTSHVNIGSYFFPNSMPTVPHMHGMPIGIGVAPPFVVPRPVFFNPPPVYFPANAPQYGRQIIIGPPRQVMYIPPGYPTDMQRNVQEF